MTSDPGTAIDSHARSPGSPASAGSSGFHASAGSPGSRASADSTGSRASAGVTGSRASAGVTGPCLIPGFVPFDDILRMEPRTEEGVYRRGGMQRCVNWYVMQITCDILFNENHIGLYFMDKVHRLHLPYTSDEYTRKPVRSPCTAKSFWLWIRRISAH
ncbi:uncharacterized protein ACWYII_028384 isoform 1-T1 [Salvelinus alpinus]